MRIGILGSGTVARSLAAGLIRIGHEIMIGTRSAHDHSAVAGISAALPSSRIGSYDDAAAFGEIVVFAVPGRVLTEVVPTLEKAGFHGTVVIDPTNPILVTDDGVLNAFGDEDSAAEYLQRTLVGSRVVKAFNQIPAAKMATPGPEESLPLRICGDDEDAKRVVSEVGTALGWKVRDIGALSRARALENAAVKWAREQRAEAQ